jgi:hypothetical protein
MKTIYLQFALWVAALVCATVLTVHGYWPMALVLLALVASIDVVSKEREP